MANTDKSSDTAGTEEHLPVESGEISDTSISHSPLDLGSGSAVAVPKLDVAEQAKNVIKKLPTDTAATLERITGVRTFFTKLHAGAIQFLDEQIAKWLQENPDVVIKRTNVVTGEIQGKKVEPNIIITVWY